MILLKKHTSLCSLVKIVYLGGSDQLNLPSWLASRPRAKGSTMEAFSSSTTSGQGGATPVCSQKLLPKQLGLSAVMGRKEEVELRAARQKMREAKKRLHTERRRPVMGYLEVAGEDVA